MFTPKSHIQAMKNQLTMASLAAELSRQHGHDQTLESPPLLELHWSIPFHSQLKKKIW